MGCNESKHDTVATGNTILRRKQSKDIETVKENPTAEIQSAFDDRDHHHEKDVVGCHESDVASTVLIEERNLDQKKESEKEDQELVEGDHDDHDQRLICRDSPNHFFSSRKDEEIILGNGIDGIISEGRSGKSEYNTPRHKDIDDDHDDHVKLADDQNNVTVNHDHDHVEADVEKDQRKELADHYDKDQSKAAEENGAGEPGDLEEDSVPKEDEPQITTAETEASVPAAEEENTAIAEEKQDVVDSPNEELKTE